MAKDGPGWILHAFSLRFNRFGERANDAALGLALTFAGPLAMVCAACGQRN
jgi:hypothetical protein